MIMALLRLCDDSEIIKTLIFILNGMIVKLTAKVLTSRTVYNLEVKN